MRIGVVACGYADSYPRVAPTGTPVLVNGVRTRTVGRALDGHDHRRSTPVPEADLGAEVTLWGWPERQPAADRRKWRAFGRHGRR